MSAQKVFDELLSYYKATGEVMKEETFASSVAPSFKLKDCLEGIQKFNKYLDLKREEAI